MRLKILPALFGFFLVTGALVSSVANVVFDHGFYLQLYEEIGLSQTTGVSEEDLQKAIFAMTDYVEGKRDDVEETITWNDEAQTAFDAKEVRHMKDVRTLWHRARAVMRASWLISAIIAVYMLVRYRIAGILDLAGGLLAGLGTLLILLLILGFWGMSDFTSFWFWFHTIVFPGNSDWLLNPATDFMIVICPEQMFSTMIVQIALVLLSALIPPAFVGWRLRVNARGLAYWKEKKVLS